MYKVLYRKYRPKLFSDVVGQQQVTRTLKNELKNGRISHAYLFTGSRGTGKTTCARILAKAVNCLNPEDGDPCGSCEICLGLDDGTVLDVVEIDAASNNGVDSIRGLIEETNFTPVRAKYRVYIIDEVHMLSAAAFNALLKTLEEPPEHVIFILATTEVHKLPATILSRCQRFDFRHISPEDIAGRLSYIASQEGADIDAEAADLIAKLADGAMRDAISILDQCLGRTDMVTLETVTEVAGVASKEYLSKLASAVKEKDAAVALGVVSELHAASKSMQRLCEEAAGYFRDLMVIKTVKKPQALVSATESELKEMTGQALKMNLSDIVHALDTLETALGKMRFSNQRTELEMAFIRLCSPELDTTNEALIRRIEALESGVIPSAPTAPAPDTSSEHRSIKRDDAPLPESPEAEFLSEPEAPPEPPLKVAVPKKSDKIDHEELCRNAERCANWPEILKIMKQYSKSIGSAFGESTAYISGDFILIDAPEFAFDLLKNSQQRDRLRDAIKQVTGKLYKLGPYKKAAKKAESIRPDPLDELINRAGREGILSTDSTDENDKANDINNIED